MNQVLQIRCPKCQSVLRVPADWLKQPVRCKHCQQVFQGVAPASEPPSTPRGEAPRTPRVSPIASGQPKSAPPKRTPAKAPVVGNSQRRRQASPVARPKIKTLPAVLVVLALCIGITVAGYFSWNLMRGNGEVQGAEKATPLMTAQANPPPDPGTGREPAPVVTPPKDKKKEESPVKTKKEPPAKKEEPNKTKDQTPPITKVDPPKTKEGPPANKVAPKPFEVPPALKEDPNLPKVPPKPRSPDDPFPRRALVISINEYLYLNPVSYGSPLSTGKPPYPGSSTQTLVALFTRPPFSILDEQITELSDGMPGDPKSSRRPRDPLKQVIVDTFEAFLNSSRPQDRIMVLFTGHTVDIDKVCFLVPLDGNKDDAETLIPLKWVLDSLAKCKAKQKVLILDVCRYPQTRGLERPGAAEDMSDDLDALLLAPPKGVQVWSSCTKGQKSYELAKGSVFLEALCTVLGKEFAKDASLQTAPLPVNLAVADVNQKMKDILEPLKLEQVSRISGFEVGNGSMYDPDEKMPPRLTIAFPKVAGAAEIAGAAQVNDILDEIKRIPPVRKGQSLPRSLPVFSSKALAEYKADYPSWDFLQDLISNDPRKYALRIAVLEAIEALNQSQKMEVLQRLPNPNAGPLDAKAKAGFLRSQQDPALKILDLQQALDKLKGAEDLRDKEGKRWQAHYDFTIARMQSRLLYIYEYNFLLGSIRLDSLPDLEKGVHNGWRLVSRDTPQVLAKEAKVKDLVKQMKRAWKKVGDEHPGTPWAIIAARDQMSAMGLEWRASKD